MCTAICFKNRYFGRNFDLDCSYEEKVIITPRNYCFKYKKQSSISNHYAIIGIGTSQDGYPLYYDAVNEVGLGAAGLNFPYSASYTPIRENSVAPFELIPYILSFCRDINSVREVLKPISVSDIPFNTHLGTAKLHWIFSDKNGSIVVEPVENRLLIYNNPAEALTNEPQFPYHLQNLNNYIHLSPFTPENTFSEKLNLSAYSLGMGGIGLPGDLSSASRFIKTVFVKENSVCDNNEHSEISQFFHILGSVSQQKGCVHTVDNKFEYTRYSSCCDLKKLIYYYKTYDNSCLSAVSLLNENLDSAGIIKYPLNETPEVLFTN